MTKHITNLAALSLLVTMGACTSVHTSSTVNQPPVTVQAPRPPLTTLVTQNPQGQYLPIENWKAVLVTARAVPTLGEVKDITSTFTFEGRIFAHLTLTAPPNSIGNKTAFEVRWFSGDKLASVQKAEYTVNKTPYYLSSSTSGTALGLGKGRIEVFANGKLVASKEFQVSEK